MEKLLKQLEKKGERELQRFSRRLQESLLKEGAKLISEEQPEEGAHPAAKSCDLGLAVKAFADLDHGNPPEGGSRDAPPESAAAVAPNEPLTAGAPSGEADPAPVAIPDPKQLEILPPDKDEGHTAVQRSPEVSELFHAQPLVEGSHVAFNCFITEYSPPELTVTWLRRDRGAHVATPLEDSADYSIVAKETCAKDGKTYQQVVMLLFTPSVQRDQGAEFICRVGHVALQTPIERSTGALEVTGVVTPVSKEIIPDSKEVMPDTRAVAAVPREVTPDSREVTHVSREVIPDSREVTAVPREVTPSTRDITPKSREIKPISREDRGPAADRKETHFVDRHREQLIQRVTLVEGILDKLLGDVLDYEQYQIIMAERTNPMKMRRLYEFMVSWNWYCKEQLYKALKDKCKFLVAELEGE
ncbi:uncharacterized protein LOC142014946 [Carettochelys insculpta]|uniref:uncharacterized protein LOC142014946 n=1 Tax=Carettochelys insculpta TaxID=44489 RepID=UPI003EBAB5AD